MSDTDEAAVYDDEATVPATKRYMEREDHVPNPLDINGSVDTTGTGGALAGRIEEMSPAFAQHRASALRAASNAVEGNGGDLSSVVLPDQGRSYDDAIGELRRAADEAENAPQLTSGLTPAQAEGAEPGEPVNPNALTGDAEHDYDVDGATAPNVTEDPQAAPGAPGAPNVNPNQDSVDAAENGGGAIVTVPDDQPLADNEREHVATIDTTNSPIE